MLCFHVDLGRSPLPFDDANKFVRTGTCKAVKATGTEWGVGVGRKRRARSVVLTDQLIHIDA